MSPNMTGEIDLTSYKFEDSNDCVIVTLYANGAIELKDIEIFSDTDSLEVSTPAGEKWYFQLYEHIYTDQTEINVEINKSRTQTTIEVRLYKQQTHTTWPQLYSRQSIPLTPKQNNQNIDMIDQQIHSSVPLQINEAGELAALKVSPLIVDVSYPSDQLMNRGSSSSSTNSYIQQQPYELSFKKLVTKFAETADNKAVLHILIKQVHNCQVQFTDTNFTVIFNTNDDEFLENNSIPSKIPIKFFVRVKERIKSDQCYHKLTPTSIDITLVKDNERFVLWHRLEPNEYSEFRSSISSSPLSTLPLSITNTNTNFMMDNINRAIPLPPPRSMDRQLDKYPVGSPLNQKDITHMSSTTPIGFTGIYNPANSCFMNAALQCLSNTRELRDYFLQSYYLVELNRTNPLGMKGAMAEEFASIIKSLWSGQSSYINANRLRDYAAKRHQEFVGNGQHDAQELLTIVLDAIHEDLNRVIDKPLVPPVEDGNRPDYIIADEYWRGYLTRNDSIIVQLFTGQFKSKTKCPQCHKESVTFDPFTSLSVPLPKRVAVDAIVIYRNDEKSPTKYRIIMSADGSIGELKRLLSNKCGLSISKMLAYKIQNNRTIEYLKDQDQVPTSGYSWNNFDLTYITEILTSDECNNETIVKLIFSQRIFKIPDFISACEYCQALPNPQSSPKFCKNCYRVSYCDEQCQKFHASDHKHYCGFRSSDNYDVIGLPFIISLPESKLTCQNVFEQIRIHAKQSVDIHIERSKQTRRSFTINNDYSNYGGFTDDEEEDSFSDIENTDWATIKSTLSSSDSWSICRIGDYFVKTSKTKRSRHQQKDRKEKISNNNNNNNDDEEGESMIISGDSSSDSSTEDFDMLDDIYGTQPLFRIMPQTTDNFYNNNDNNNFQPIIEHGDDGDKILRCHTTFSIDWFTDNKMEAPLRVTPSKNRSGINGLIEDDSLYNSSNGDQDVTLQQCLQLFIEPEVLGPDDKWYCPHCKEHIQAEKKMSVWRLPPILIIHLKRFKYNQCSSFGYMSNSREKIESTVKFPIYDLNMSPYCSSISEENSVENPSSQSRYDLYGIINHRGTAWFGHYTSYARLLANNDSAKTEIGWRNFDDERVSTLPNIKDLARSDAYVLFYRHRNLSVNFSVHEQVQRIFLESTRT